MAETYVTLSSLKHYDEKNKELIATKQDKLVGAENQVVSFDENGNVISKDLETIDTSNFVTKEDGKGLFSGSYNDLTNKPTIPSTDGLVSEDSLNNTLSGYAKKTDLPDEYDDTQLKNRVAQTENAINTLNGNGDGSVSKTVDNALNDFATKISNDNVVNTYKELVDYAAENSAEIAEIVGNISSIQADMTNKVDKVSGKGLSTNDLTATLKSNYDTAYTHSQSSHAPSNAEKNTIVGIQKNGTDLTVHSSTRKVNITVPTKTSELTNDSNFISSETTLSKGNDTTATKTLSHGSTFTAITDTSVSGHKITDTTTTYTLPSITKDDIINSLGYTPAHNEPMGVCVTEKSDDTKVVSATGYSEDEGAIITVRFTKDVGAGAAIQINDGVSHPIRHVGGLIKDGVIFAENLATFKHIGDYYYLIAVNDFVDDNTITTVTTTGSGNAITSITASNGTITATKGSTFLTAHPTISKSTDSTSTTSPSHGGTFTAVDSITRDTNGHVTKVNTKTVTLPSVSSFMLKNNPSGTGTLNMNGTTNGSYSTALGSFNKTEGNYSLAEGYNNIAFGAYSHVEGNGNNALAPFAPITPTSVSCQCKEVNTANIEYNGIMYAKVAKTILSSTPSPSTVSPTGYYLGSVSNANSSQVMDNVLIYFDGTTTLNVYSPSYSLMNFAGVSITVTFEKAEITISTESIHVQGKYSLIDNNYAHVVGNGTSEENRSNAHTLDWDGNATFAGDVKATDASGNTVSLLDIASNSGDSGTLPPYYVGTCSTSASTSAKTVSISNFELKVGVEVHVIFSNTNTSSSATLNVSSTGAKAMYYKDGTRMYYIPNGVYHTFVYDGTYWRYLGSDNAIISNRSYERYGLKMSNSSLVPLVSGYSISLGSSSNKLGTVYATSVGSESTPVNYVYGDGIYANTLFTKTGTYRTRVLPPLPLLYGNFTVSSYHTITFNSNICQNYVKSFYNNYLNTGSDVTSSGCAYPGSAQGNTYDVGFLFRVFGYDSTSGKQAVPFVQEFALTTAYTTMSCGDNSTDWYIFTTPCGNKVYFYLTGISIDSCGYVSGNPSLNIGGTTSTVHFSEIALMP